MKAKIYISGVIGEETTLTDVIRQFKSYAEPDEVEVTIHSQGGNVEKGDAIYNYLKTLDLTIPVTTITDKAYSIAAKIFTAGRVRIIEDIESAAMIHFAWAKVEGKAEKLEMIAEELREMEQEFTSFYAELLNIDEETAKALLDNETFLSGEEAVELGFATELKTATKAVAIYKNENNLKSKKMSKQSLKSKGQLLLDAFAAFLKPEEVEVVALVLQDSNGAEIDFADLESGETPKVGDKGTIDGSPIPDGEYIIPSMDEATVVFVDGAISEIKPKDTDEANSPSEEPQAKTEIKAETVKEIIVWDLEVVNTTFAIGDTVLVKWGEEESSIGATEFQVKDGRRIVTDASGVIVTIKEADANIPSDIDVEAQVEAMLKKVETKVQANFEAKFIEQEKEIKGLKKLIGSKEFNAEQIHVDENTRTEKSEQNKLAGIFSSANKNK